jgi:hypothetical protein
MNMLADSIWLDPGLLAVYGFIGGAVVTIIVSRGYYRMTRKDISDEGSALKEQVAELKTFMGDALSHREDRVEEISNRIHVDKSVVRRVVNALSEELLDSVVRAALLEVQDAQGKVNPQRLFAAIAKAAPPGAVAQSQSILNDMRNRGEIEFDGDLGSTETIQLVQLGKAGVTQP